MIPTDIIEENKNEFIDIVRSIEREGSAIESLIDMLETSDFFYAPASTKYHGAYPGGLCEHCLDTYKELKSLVEKFPQYFYESDSIKILGLFHDIAKINLYKKDIRNKKFYHENGSKFDSLGLFDWVSEEVYSVDHDRKFIYGSHEQTCEFLVRQYFPLTLEESIALLHHHGGMNWDSTQTNISEIYNKYPLALLLHTADMLSTYIDQNE